MKEFNDFETLTIDMGAKKTPIFVDLFVGAGGLSRGLEMAGWKCVLGTDWDRPAMETFKRNHAHAEVFTGDISNLTEERLRELTKNRKVNLVCGGPPCQGFSTVGKGMPTDPRNQLFLHFMRVIKILSPDYILMENVTGLVSRKNEKVLESILSEFEELGYDVDVRVLSAHHYGVPQKRRRTIFIGNKRGIANIYPALEFDAGEAGLPPSKTIGEAIEDLKAPDGRTYNHDVDAASIPKDIDKERMKRVPEGRYIRYEKDELEFLPKELRLGVDWNNIDEGRFRQAKYRRLGRNEPSPTIMTGRHSYFHPTELRYLTVREAAAIQSFPNDFMFEGTISQQWKQVGNAVPPLLGKALGETILRMDSKGKKTNAEKMHIAHIRKHAFNYKTAAPSKEKQAKITDQVKA